MGNGISNVRSGHVAAKYLAFAVQVKGDCAGKPAAPAAQRAVRMLKKIIAILAVLPLLYNGLLKAQHEEHLEQLAEPEHERLENDEVQQERESRLAQRLDLNAADDAALHRLGLLTAAQIAQLQTYRKLLGPMVSIYELQAVPGFDLASIQRILPYVKAGIGLEPVYTFGDYLRLGKHTLLLRYARAFSIGQNDGGSTGGQDQNTAKEKQYDGSADKLMLRYRYQFSPYLSWGVVMEKDAGERFFRGAQRLGFDHYGAHMFVRRPGVLKALALGDYTVNMGQGLIQWHGLSFGKSGNVMQVKREGETLRPYASAGEFYFFRGAGVTIRKGLAEWTVFLSRRSLDAADSSGSLTSSGYHRTAAEVAKRGAVLQYSAGTVFKWWLPRGHIAFNALAHRFSKPFIKGKEAYRLYAAAGNTFYNAGVDYAVNWRNVHWFGEAAVNRSGGYAVLQGMLASLAHAVDASLVFRHETVRYQAWYANAFGESAAAGNETGLYAALQVRFGRRWSITAYADVFRFPWLKYRIDAPSQGYDTQVALTWQPDKTTSIVIRYQFRQAASGDTLPPRRQQLHCQLIMPVIAKAVTWKCRLQAGVTTWLMHQQFDARWEQWRIGAGYTWYDAADKEAVFVAGQGFPADNALARFSGAGWSTSVLVQRRVMRDVTLWGRWQYAPGGQHLQLQLQMGW